MIIISIKNTIILVQNRRRICIIDNNSDCLSGELYQVSLYHSRSPVLGDTVLHKQLYVIQPSGLTHCSGVPYIHHTMQTQRCDN